MLVNKQYGFRSNFATEYAFYKLIIFLHINGLPTVTTKNAKLILC
jgi:hypothetical protein